MLANVFISMLLLVFIMGCAPLAPDHRQAEQAATVSMPGALPARAIAGCVRMYFRSAIIVILKNGPTFLLMKD